MDAFWMRLCKPTVPQGTAELVRAKGMHYQTPEVREIREPAACGAHRRARRQGIIDAVSKQTRDGFAPRPERAPILLLASAWLDSSRSTQARFSQLRVEAVEPREVALAITARGGGRPEHPADRPREGDTAWLWGMRSAAWATTESLDRFCRAWTPAAHAIWSASLHARTPAHGPNWR